MRFQFNLNASQRDLDEDSDSAMPGRFNIPTSPYVQIAVNSPYFLPSPYLEGSSYKGGKSYEIRVTMNENHLLESPYQTNCTEYMKPWIENGGRGPMNQLNVIQECRANRWHSIVGCVPIRIDYPHSYDICGTSTASDPNNTQLVSEEKCLDLADSYNQPCHSISYSTTKEERDITIEKNIEVRWLHQNETVRTTIPGYDCNGTKVWQKECSKIRIDILFDRFEITNLTYNAKYESLELFSVLGGYMGMWLGISLVAIYDFIGSALKVVKKWGIKKYKKRKQQNKVKNAHTTLRKIENNVIHIA